MSNLLIGVSDSEVLCVLGTIHLDYGHAVASVEAWVLTSSELIELVSNILKILSEGPEHKSEFLLLFLQIHQSSKE